MLFTRLIILFSFPVLPHLRCPLNLYALRLQHEHPVQFMEKERMAVL
jgi:hypothetical protein